ncbi:MAG: MerR family transcriptional regulator [Elusimicrobia bacterium]|nr:MerR family transcriptional regulator [Elusimicrobiota bacterium]
MLEVTKVTQFIPADKTFFSIGEVSQFTQVKPYVLRYWESAFRLLRPARRVSGQRKYTKRDIELIFKIKRLLYEQGFTIAGAKRYLIEERRRRPEQLPLELAQSQPALELLQEVKQELGELLEVLRSRNKVLTKA